MKKIKYLIIGLSIIIVIIASMLLKIVIDKHVEYRKQEGDLSELEQGDKVVLKEAGSLVDNFTIYNTVENCVKKYIEYCGMEIIKESENDDVGSRYDKINISEVLGITSEQEKNRVIYSILEKNYIEENNITINNISQYVNKVNSDATFKTIRMNEVQGERISKYLVYGKVNEQDLYVIVNIDSMNNSFSIRPIINSGISVKEILVAKNIEEISRNDNNVYTYIRMNTEDIVRRYFSDYKEKVLNNVEEAYAMVEAEYKNVRFENLEDFKKYVENNKKSIAKAVAAKYQVAKTDEYTQYVVIDQDGNYYIFRETAVMEYTVILDTYSIELPEFLEKYNSANEQQKVALNINKFMNAINKKDYKYAYSKLAEGFKQNYFRTQEQFENYVKNNFFESNQIKFEEFGNQATIYTYTTTLTNKETNQTKKQNFVVSLGEGTEFEMSFEI